MDAKRYSVTVWDVEAPPAGRLLVLPGRKYTVDHPLLMWACRAAAEIGWQVTTMAWHVDSQADDDPEGFVADAAELLDDAAPTAPSTVVLAKSLSSYAAAWAAQRRYAGIWLTPLLHRAGVKAALADPGAPTLLVGGTADPSWNKAAAAAAGGEVLEIADGDHSLQISADWRRSLAALNLVMETIERFLQARVNP